MAKTVEALRSVVVQAVCISMCMLLMSSPSHGVRHVRAASDFYAYAHRVEDPGTPPPSVESLESEAPVIESTAPYSSPAGSGLWMSITGSNFSAVTRARLLSSSASAEGYDIFIAASTAESLWLWVSDGMPVGRYALELCTMSGLCTQRTEALELYFDGVAIGYVWPSSQLEGETTTAYIYGSGLLPGVTVTIGGAPATNVTAYGTWAVLDVPAGLPVGRHDVTVMLSGTSATLGGAFSVLGVDAGTPTPIETEPAPQPTPQPTPDIGIFPPPVASEPPAIESSTPYSAPVMSGPWLSVTGRNFDQVSRVRVLPSDASSEAIEVYFVSAGAQEMSVFIYDGVPTGRYALELCTAAGQCATLADALLLYDGGVSIGYVAPGASSVGVAADVYIYGRGLAPEVTVTIGGRPATVVQVYNATVMHVRTPADLPIGRYDVTAVLSGMSSTMAEAFVVMGDAVESIWPDRQISGTAAEIYLYGYGFTDGMSVTIGGLPVTDLQVFDASNMQVRTPAELPIGMYDVVVAYPGMMLTLPAAYTVIEEQRSDWFALEHDLWTSPADLREGETAAIGLTVYRRGGDVPRQAQVSFYVVDDGVPQLIDVVPTTLLDPGTLWHSVGQASTSWVVESEDDEVTLMAVIAAEGQNEDLDSTNNVVTRTISVLPSTPESAAPQIESMKLNGGALETSDRSVTVTIDLTRTATMMLLVEHTFGTAAGLWVPVQSTGWIRFEREYPLALTGSSGLRYVQAWVSDEMGNVSSSGAMAGINYNAAPEEIERGQVRMFRYPATAGQAMTVTLETLSGDADLYVWSSDGSAADRSTADSIGIDRVVVAPSESGEYQIEVYGYEDSTYRLTVENGASAKSASQTVSAMARPETKALRSAPVVLPESMPSSMMALSNAPIIALPEQAVAPPSVESYTRVHLPITVR